MPNLATWMRQKDEKWFQPFLAKQPDIRVFDARKADVSLDQMDGLLLTGGSDILPEVFRQEDADPSGLGKNMGPQRGPREFQNFQEAPSRRRPSLAICKRLH